MYALTPTGRPLVFSVDPANKSVLLGPIPDITDYTLRGKYWTKSIVLAADADIPACPDEYHMVIVYRALMKYAGYEAASEVKQAAVEEYSHLIRALEHNQLDAVGFGAPLA
jgi:hypothetical protein